MSIVRESSSASARKGFFARDMVKRNAIIGRPWPIYPTMSRVTTGTKEEMIKFKAAMDKVMGV